MALKLKPSQSAEFELPSEGSHQAVCVCVIDLGTQDNTYEGVTTTAHKVFIGFEVADESKASGEPFVLGRDYTFSLNEKAALRGLVKALRNKDVGIDEELDLRALLGKPCIISLEAKTTSGGKSYVKLTGVQPPMRGSKPTRCRLEAIFWEIDSGETFPDAEWLPYLYGRPLLQVVESSHEWRQGQTPANDEIAF